MRFYEFLKEAKQTGGIQIMSLDQFANQGSDKELDEADLLGAPTKDFPDSEMQDYLRTTVDKTKTASQRYKMPYVHRSSALKFYDESGKRFDLDKMKGIIAERPKKLLKQNEKMEHSNGEKEQFFNVGFAALTGLALDEKTKEFKIVNTCPGAGSCKVDCFARGGGKVQFEGPWVSDARILTFLLNDPEGFKKQLMSEIAAQNKKYEKQGTKVTIRWHDAGDFFSPEYVDLAADIARAFPDNQFYAYTKIAKVAQGGLPSNFKINWSEGANTSQEKQIKMADPRLEKTKHSRIVPAKLTDGTPIFNDLLKKDAEGKLEKTAAGGWIVTDMNKLKDRIAELYKIPKNTILDYDEMMAKPEGKDKKWNVIIVPGQGDISAKRSDVLGTLLLKH
jgi:hypothetical protein